MYTYLNCHVFFKYLAILSGKYILKNQPPIKINKFEFNKKTKKTENNKNSKNFNAFYIIYFRYYTWYVKGFFFFPDNNEWDSLDIQKSKKPWKLSRQSSHIKNI